MLQRLDDCFFNLDVEDSKLMVYNLYSVRSGTFQGLNSQIRLVFSWITKSLLSHTSQRKEKREEGFTVAFYVMSSSATRVFRRGQSYTDDVSVAHASFPCVLQCWLDLRLILLQLLLMQSNPGWGFDRKCQFMDKLVDEFSKAYKWAGRLFQRLRISFVLVQWSICSSRYSSLLKSTLLWSSNLNNPSFQRFPGKILPYYNRMNFADSPSLHQSRFLWHLFIFQVECVTLFGVVEYVSM